jgi:hypothetical protein
MIDEETPGRFHVKPGTRARLKDHDTVWKPCEEPRRLEADIDPPAVSEEQRAAFTKTRDPFESEKD